MKKLLLYISILLVGQNSSAAILKVKNGSSLVSDKALAVTIYWHNGTKEKTIFRDEKYYDMDSGLNPITAISWRSVSAGYNMPAIVYRVPLEISTLSISHYIEILPKGIFRYDGKQFQAVERHVEEEKKLDKEWIVVDR